MKLTIKSKYLVFPVNTLARKKALSFRSNNETVYRLNIKLDQFHPDFFAYIDVQRFMGQELELTVSPDMPISFREADEMDIRDFSGDPLRPQVHFTTKNGWINDPNGLILLDGIYHMFYQYNPAEPNWENMHWGHAESTDLIHWVEKDTALFPDDRGTMFSGSAILDEKNTLGKATGDEKTALLYYTTTDPFCQQLSYSTDNFKTIHRFSDQPVVAHITGGNRDPKVIFCEELDCYIMALYLEDDLYCIMRSDDLAAWTLLQQIQLPGDNECPDIFPLRDENGERWWVLIGAHDKYLVGRFESGRFVPKQAIQSLHYGNSAYAGQSFSNLPDGRIVRVEWDVWNELPTASFKGQMGIPMELTLRQFRDIHYLEANPVRELTTLYKDSVRHSNVALKSGRAFSVPLEDTAYEFKLNSDTLADYALDLQFFGVSLRLDAAKNEIKLGSCSSPLSLTSNGLDVTVIADRCSVELYADGGKIFISCLDGHTFADRNLPIFSIRSENDTTLNSVEVHSLHSIWGNE